MTPVLCLKQEILARVFHSTSATNLGSAEKTQALYKGKRGQTNNHFKSISVHEMSYETYTRVLTAFLFVICRFLAERHLL